MFSYQFFEKLRFAVAGDYDNGIFRTIPTLVKQLQGFGRRSAQGFGRTNGCPHRQALIGEEQGTGRILNLGLRSLPFVQFGQNYRALCIDSSDIQPWGGDHAGNDLDALIQTGPARIGKVQFVNSLGGRGFRIAVAAKGRAEPLPYPLCLTIRHISGTAKRQMFHEMGETPLIFPLHQRPYIEADANGDLPRRNTIAFHRIAQTIVQFTKGPAFVHRNVAASVQPRNLGFSPPLHWQFAATIPAGRTKEVWQIMPDTRSCA